MRHRVESGSGSRRQPAHSKKSEAGSVSLGFVGALGLLLILVFTVVSVALSLYVKAVMEDSAAEGARLYALEGGSATYAEYRTRELIRASLPSEFASNVQARREDTSAVVTVTAPMPLVGLVSGAQVTVRASVPMEHRNGWD